MSKSFKRNYVDVYQIITPSYYKGLDISLSSDTVDIVDRILESDFKLIEENLRVIPLSAEPLATILGYDGNYCSALPQYFVKQNKLTNVTPEEFELVVLNPIGYSMKDYNTSGDFSAFVVNTLLPNIGIGFDSTVNNIFQRSQGKYADTEEATHRYLLESLGLFHILSYQRGASTGVTLNYRTELAELYSRKLFAGETLELADAIKVMKTAIWKCENSSVKDPVFFDLFALGQGTYTSGDQQLDKMNTWTDVIYNENYSEETDEYVRDAVEEFMDNGTYPDNEIPNGPFYRFQRAVGFLTADINDQIVSLETLHSIENCPTNLLPYLADIIGWEFYTSNTDAWRRQLRSAVSLYKKKGTSGGLEDLLKVILPSFDLDFDEMYSEFYESYVPNLIYYMLKTESFLTSGTGAWTPALANDFAGGEFDPINIDASVRFVVDHILLEAVDRFPHLFNIRGYQFDIADPDFVFNYRGRNFPIPPWESEKFYKDCAVNEQLAEFLQNKLVCLGVTEEYAEDFYDYLVNNIQRERANDTRYYGVGFLFFTSGLELPPNYNKILDNYERDSFNLIPLWSGKSSHFDLSLSTADINDEFFAPGAFDREDFFASLEAIPRFVPAKAIPRSHVDLTTGDPYISFVSLSPRATTSFMSYNSVSGALGGFTDTGLDMRSDKAALLGKHVYGGETVTEDLSKTRVNHANRPAFKRSRLKFGRFPNQIDTNNPLSGSPFTLSGDDILTQNPPVRIQRGTVRRRDNSKHLWKGDWFTRTGFNDPTRLNKGRGTSYGLGTSSLYLPLGFSLSGFRFQPVTDYFDLPAVYEACEVKDVTNSSVYNGVETSSTFPVRGSIAIPDEMTAFSNQGHLYRFRDDIDDVPRLMYEVLHMRIQKEVELYLERNFHLFGFNAWKDFYQKLYNVLWDEYTYNQEELHEIIFSKYERRTGKHSLRDLFYLYENNFAEIDLDVLDRNDQRVRYDQNTAYSLLESYKDGGDNILSRIYGPFVYNGLLTVDGSAIGSNEFNSKIVDINDSNEFSLTAIDKNDTAYYYDQPEDLYIEKAEYRTPHYFSGVEIAYRPDSQDSMSVFSLSSNGNILPEDSALLENNMVGLKVLGNGTRFRYRFNYGPEGSYGPSGVSLDPEHEYSITTRSIFLDENSSKTGDREYAVWIHTEPEYDFNNNLIYWNYSKDGKWEKRDASEVTSKNGYSLVVNELAHLTRHEGKDLSEQTVACYSEEDNFSRAWSVRSSDLVEDVINFNTFNQPIKVPLDYFRVREQVHSATQKYVIEVFPLKDLQKSKFWLFDGISVIDETVKEQSLLELNLKIDDYRLEQLANPNAETTVRFFDPSGNWITSGNVMDVDTEGNITYNGHKVTAALAHSETTYSNLPRPKLYTKPEVIRNQVFYTNGTTQPEQAYGGKFYQTNYTLTGLYPTNIRVYPKTRGSYIKYEEKQRFLLDPRTLLEVMSFFKAKSQEVISRRKNKVNDPDYKEGSFTGYYGGFRQNYRDIVNDEWDVPFGTDILYHKNIILKN